SGIRQKFCEWCVWCSRRRSSPRRTALSIAFAFFRRRYIYRFRKVRSSIFSSVRHLARKAGTKDVRDCSKSKCPSTEKLCNRTDGSYRKCRSLRSQSKHCSRWKRKPVCQSAHPFVLRNRRPKCSRSCRSRSEEHTSELQSRFDLVCRLQLE